MAVDSGRFRICVDQSALHCARKPNDKALLSFTVVVDHFMGGGNLYIPPILVRHSEYYVVTRSKRGIITRHE